MISLQLCVKVKESWLHNNCRLLVPFKSSLICAIQRWRETVLSDVRFLAVSLWCKTLMYWIIMISNKGSVHCFSLFGNVWPALHWRLIYFLSPETIFILNINIIFFSTLGVFCNKQNFKMQKVVCQMYPRMKTLSGPDNVLWCLSTQSWSEIMQFFKTGWSHKVAHEVIDDHWMSQLSFKCFTMKFHSFCFHFKKVQLIFLL